jgi:hypothetical protein
MLFVSKKSIFRKIKETRDWNRTFFVSFKIIHHQLPIGYDLKGLKLPLSIIVGDKRQD